MESKKGVFVNYQMAEAINLLVDLVDKEGKIKDRKLAEEKLKKLKDKWSEDKIPGYGINIGDKNAGMQGLTIDEVAKFATDIKTADTYSTECIGNMQYCLVRDEKGNVDFDFSYLRHIADLARANGKKLIIDSAVVFGDRFPENMANMKPKEVANAISIYIQKLIREFGDCIERIDVLNSIFQRDVFDRNGKINSEEFWKDKFGQDYASKVLSIVKQNCQHEHIKLCWNEFYMTKSGSEKRREDFITAIENIKRYEEETEETERVILDGIGLQDNFRPDTSCKYIQDSLEEIAEVCRKCGKKISITELSCKVGKRDTESLNEAKQNGNYSSKVEELNARIRKVLKTVIDFSESKRNSDIISSVEARYSDRYDCNHRKCEQRGHNIQTSIRRDNVFEQPDILKSAIEATEEKTRTSTINQQVQTIRSVQKERTQQQTIGNNGTDR